MNLIDLYLQAQGESEVPPDLHKWAFISLLAATVRDQIYIEKDGKLFPNLYVLLICSSGVGKGKAINGINRLATIPDLKQINPRRIKLTAASLIDLLSAKVDKLSEYHPSKVFLITPELANSVGSGQQAKDLVRMLTDLYDAGEFNPEEFTRTSGRHLVRKPLPNWIGGTTRQWLMDCIDAPDIFSGFTARTICLQADFDPSKKFVRPIFPADRKDILEYIQCRLIGLTKLHGEIKFSPEAEEEEEEWYNARTAPPETDPTFAVFRREHDQILKLSTVMMMASEDHWSKKIITVEDWRDGKAEIESTTSKLSDLFNYAIETPQSQIVERARNILRQSGKLPHSALLRRLRVRSDEFQHVINTLEETREVRGVTVGSGERTDVMYYWREDEHDFRNNGNGKKTKTHRLPSQESEDRI